MVKHQIPSTCFRRSGSRLREARASAGVGRSRRQAKFQTNPNDRNPKSQMNRFGYLDIWIWNLFGIWSLRLGISNHNSFLVPAAVAAEMAKGIQ